ncbi:MAG: hypothetical protein ACI8TX_000782 [Hyphomicrobiaceae bacterium]|jgi:hypothetical protein
MHDDLPPYDIARLRAAPFTERIRLLCRTWLFRTTATPPAVYALYIFKISFLYVGGWWFFCSLTPGFGSITTFPGWALTATAFQKAVLWSLFYEGFGLGCSTGPLTGRFIPPIGGALHFLRPGTTKLALVPGLPVFGGIRRTPLDVALYAATLVLILRALVAPEITSALVVPIAVLVPILGLTDKTIFLAARSEHYWVAAVCLAFAPTSGVWIAGCKLVWLAIWFWAATSKLNSHFPSVICVMLTNSPFVPQRLREALYEGYPNDLRPSRVAEGLAHMGTLVEYGFPLVLLAGNGGTVTFVALAVMISFHCFIAGNLPMGMPIEWNVAMVFGGAFLFGRHAEASIAAITQAPVLGVFLFAMLFAVPLFGNFVPSRVSFLMAMRYYAGNWAYSVWLFRGDSIRKLDRLVKVAPLMRDQLARLIDNEDEVDAAMMMTPTFRLLHLQGRVLHEAIPKAVDDIEAYEWMDGELIAGLALGWNFGDGHLHGPQLLRAIQEQCDFEEGELRVVTVESQPMAGRSMAWVIYDAVRGELDRGQVEISRMRQWQPWPTDERAQAFDASTREGHGHGVSGDLSGG